VSTEQESGQVDSSDHAGNVGPREAHAPEFGVGKSIVFSLILISLIFGIGEFGVRSWAYYLREDVEKYDPETETFILIPGVHRSSSATIKINSQGFVGRELEVEHPALRRIVAVGDSCTFGAGDEKNTYPAMLGARLEQLEKPGRDYEVVNAGISGLNSGLALRRLTSKVLPLDPYIVTIYIGWNDLMKFSPSAQGNAAFLSGVARRIDSLWLVKGLRKLLFFYLRPILWPPKIGPSESGQFVDFKPTIYQDNLLKMIEAVQGAGSRAVLFTLPTVVRPDMSVDDLRAARVVFPYFRSSASVGDLLDLLDAYNRLIRRIGVEQQVPVIDLARTFERLPTTQGYFWDTMHMSPKGMEFAADAILVGLKRDGLLDGVPSVEHHNRKL
jgi:lysophospholipase L1-like esterase